VGGCAEVVFADKGDQHPRGQAWVLIGAGARLIDLNPIALCQMPAQSAARLCCAA